MAQVDDASMSPSTGCQDADAACFCIGFKLLLKSLCKQRKDGIPLNRSDHEHKSGIKGPRVNIPKSHRKRNTHAFSPSSS